MDWVRSCYTTSIRPYHDSGLTVPIKWYFVDKDTPPLPFRHRFGSRIWNDDRSPQPLGETTAQRKWANGQWPARFAGHCPLGEESAWVKGISIESPDVPTTSAGVPLECLRVPAGGVYLAGVASWTYIPHAFFGGGGIGLEGEARAPTEPTWTAWGGLRGGGAAGVSSASAVHGYGGAQLAGRARVVAPEVVFGGGGLELAGLAGVPYGGGVLAGGAAELWAPYLGAAGGLLGGGGATFGGPKLVASGGVLAGGSSTPPAPPGGLLGWGWDNHPGR
jgi:hypothetical protein